MSTKFQTLKGFRDFYPEETAFQTWFYQNIREVSELFGFQEYNGPTIEPLSLYAAKSGEELVKKQAFTLKDKSGETLVLRPEMTPTLAKMVAQKENSLTFPVRWFTYGSRFRYENPQKGRGREFFQWDADILGPETPLSDAEIICLAATFYQKIGLTPNEVTIKVNDRQYLQNRLLSINIPQVKIFDIFKIIDKKSKVDEETFEKMLIDVGLNKEQVEKLYKILNDKSGWKESSWLSKIFSFLDEMGVKNFIEFDPTIVRGLDYYTRTVFEGWDTRGKFRSIWGGGRYDNLTRDVGGKQKISGVGFAMGDMVIQEILKENKKYPNLQINRAKVLITVFSTDLLVQSIKAAKLLRAKGINVDLYPDPEIKLEKQLKYADKKKIPYVIIIGPEEVKDQLVVLKDLQTGDQKKVKLEDLTSLIK